jgi:DNA polymerase I-like protein with 3'-5' exonuclease and polymerase domains
VTFGTFYTLIGVKSVIAECQIVNFTVEITMITLDFETEGIVGNPLVKPPAPVGLAIQVNEDQPQYVTGLQAMYDALSQIYAGHDDLLFHNAPFDTRVAEDHLALPMPKWQRIHDTQYVLYMNDPYAQTLSLKPSAERWLNEPPEEQDELRDWILRHVPEATPSSWGGFISVAPASIVEPYAKGDVHRTFSLYRQLRPSTPTEAYDRERRLMPILVRSTQRGVRIAREALGEAIEKYTEALRGADDVLLHTPGVPGLNLDSPAQMGTALVDGGWLGDAPLLTATGKIQTNKKALEAQIKDPKLLNLIRYRQALTTCLESHMSTWYDLSEEDGRVHAEWSQVRSTDRGKSGTRTGRMSCARPNLQNPPTEFDFDPPEGLPEMPILRRFFLPEEGHVWCKRDFSGQEVRIAAHFEDDILMRAFQKNPNLDAHELARVKILETTGKEFRRGQVKITAFQIIYGGGAPAISAQVGCSLAEAAELKDAYLSAMPGIRALQRSTKQRGYAKNPIRTWGGREYLPEPPKMIKGRMRSFEYKLLNYLIQGSAADQTKQCMNDWEDQRGPDDVFLIQVHDEMNISAPAETWEKSMAVLQDAMDQDLFDVPARSEGFVGDNWGDIKETW